MDDSEWVHVSDSDDNLLADESWLSLLQELELLDKLEQVFARTQLSDDVHVGFSLQAVFELDK